MPTVKLSRDGDLALLTLDDGKANALNGASLTELESALEEAASADALVIAGRAGFFSGGLDIKTLPGLPAETLTEVLEQFARVMLRLVGHPRPVIGAVSGHAIAGGAVLTLTTDEAYAAEGPFKIGLNETAINIGLPRFIVEMARLRLAIGSQHAAVAEGRLFDPEGARNAGFVQAVVPAAELTARAHERARALSGLPPAYGENKRKLRAPILGAGGEAFTEELAAFTAFVRGTQK